MRQPTILLVDRDSDSVNIYSLMLRHHGFDVLLASDPDEAMRTISDRHPDVVISALSRPRMDGVAFIERILADGMIGTTRVIVLDSVRGFEDLAGKGLVTRLVKPCEPSRLLKEVQRALGEGRPVIH